MGQIKTPERIRFEQMRAVIAPMVGDLYCAFSDEKLATEFLARVSNYVMGGKRPPRPHRSLAPMENFRRYLMWVFVTGICGRFRSRVDRADAVRLLEPLGREWLYQDGRPRRIDWNAARHEVVVHNKRKARKPSYRGGGASAA